MRKNLKLGLFGFGCVGQGLYHVLHETRGVKAEIKKICVKQREKQRAVKFDLLTFDKFEILDDKDIDVVVELIDDAAEAFQIVKAALLNGKAVVTANKRMLAENLEELFYLQRATGKPLLYEGAVCGSIPIVRNLEEYYDNDLVQRIEGIFNGSTNYILTKVFEEKKQYSDALKDAQQLGFAETDPTLDVKAFDPKFKLSILISHAFGLFIRPENIVNIGIDQLGEPATRYAKENNYSIKLIARAFKEGERIYGFVAPQFIEKADTFASVRNEFNAIVVQGAFAEKQVFIGKGAGSFPTASAVLSDISALTYEYAYEYKKLSQSNRLLFSNELVAKVFVSFGDDAAIRESDFVTVESSYKSNENNVIIGQAELNKLAEWTLTHKVSIVIGANADFTTALTPDLTSHKVAESSL